MKLPLACPMMSRDARTLRNCLSRWAIAASAVRLRAKARVAADAYALGVEPKAEARTAFSMESQPPWSNLVPRCSVRRRHSLSSRDLRGLDEGTRPSRIVDG